MSLPKHTLLYNLSNTTGIPHIIINKLASLIRFSIFQLRNNNYPSPTPISLPLLQEETYKIKRNLNTSWVNF